MMEKCGHHHLPSAEQNLLGGGLWQCVLWVSTRLHAAVLIAGGFLNGKQFVGIG